MPSVTTQLTLHAPATDLRREGGSRIPLVKNPEKEEPRERRRFHEVYRRIVGPHVVWYANHVGVSDATIRAWKLDGASVPRDTKKYLRLIGVNPKKLKHDDEGDWDRYVDSLPEGVIPTTEPELPSWLHRTPDWIAASRLLDRGSAVIIGAVDLHGLLLASDVKNSVKVNIQRGINYLFIIPTDAHRRSELVRFARLICVPSSLGSISIMTAKVSSEDRMWMWFEGAILFSRPNLTITQAALGQLEVENFRAAFEQLYKPADTVLPDETPAISGRHLWISMPHQDAGVYIDLLMEWSATAEWFSGTPPPES